MKKVALLILILSFVISCSNENKLNIIQSNIGNNAYLPESEPIVIKFDKDVWLVSDYEKDKNNKYIKFEPNIDGAYYWNSPSELRFTPFFGNILPGVEYKATLSEDIIKQVPTLKLPSENVLTFNTGFIDFENVEYYWDVDKPSGESLLYLIVKMNMPFKTEQDVEHFEYFIDNKKLSPISNTKYNDNQFAVVFNDKSILSDGEKEVKIVLKPGLLIGLSAQARNSKEISKTLKITGANDFIVTGSTSETNATNCSITFTFNHALATDIDYTGFIYSEPAISNISLYPYNNQLTITGDLAPGSTYKIILKPGLPSILGAKLKEESIEFVKLGDLEPFIGFAESDAIYLPSQGSRKVAVNMLGVKDLYLNIYKVYENNIINAFGRGQSYNEFYDDESEEYFWFYNYDISQIGDMISTKKIDVSNLEKSNNSYLLKIDFNDYLREKGMYVVQLVDSSNIQLQTDRIFSVSDLGLLTKTNDDDLFVSVNTLSSAQPVSSAKVTLISANNQIVESVNTNSEGVAMFRNLSERKNAKIPKLIRVEKGNDINYIFLGENTVFQTYIFDFLGGTAKSDYKAFIYGDRELYRPGDTMHIAGIVRDENRKTMSGIPIKLQMILPNGKPFKEFVAETDDNGGFSISHYISPNTLTGTYKIRAYTSGKNKIGESRVSIEQFIPERIKVTLNTDKDNYKSGEIMKISGLVENLFGTPAPNRTFDGDILISEKEFKNRNLRDYTFKLSNTNIQNISDALSGESDNNGKIYKEEPLEINNIGNIELAIMMNVYDEGNRPVRSTKKVSVSTQPYFVGVGKINNWLNVNTNYNIPLVAVKSDGSSAGKANANVQIIRKTWNSVLRHSDYGDRYYYESEERSEVVMNKQLTIDGLKGNVNFKTGGSGIYEVRVALPGAESYVAYQLMVYGSDFVGTGAFEVSKDGYVDIDSEFEKYNIGDKARLLFKTPFNGRLVVTVERNGIIDNYSLNTNERTAELTLDIKDSYLPNVYISAVLIRAVNDFSIPIMVAYGYHALKIEKPSTILPLTISANATVRTGTNQTVKIKTLPKQNINVTIAVVDEGIHQIKRTKTPSPHNYFYEKIALNVKTYDVYKLVFPEQKVGNFNFGGGDEAYDLSAIDNLVMNRFADERVKPVAFWSGILKTNSAGEASYSFDVPNFSGALRVSAVAYLDEAFGSTDTNMLVRDPLIISTSLPRFLGTGDESFAIVNVSNTTNSEKSVSIDVKSNGYLVIKGNSTSSIKIPANSEKRLQIPVKASNSEGLAEITVTAKGGGESANQIVKLPVRYPAGYTRNYESGSINGNSSKNINFSDKFTSNSIYSNVTISRLPVVEFFNGLEFLVEYPHGCMEQTISKAFPLIYYPDLLKASRINADSKLTVDAKRYVTTAIDRAVMLQLPEGGWGMWESNYDVNWWTSVYVTHFLISAKSAGYTVDDKTLNKALGFIKSKSLNSEKRKVYNNFGASETQTEYYPREAIYGLFVLSLAGKGEFAALNFYKSALSNLTSESRVLLAGAYKLLGDNTNYRNILQNYEPKSEKYFAYRNSDMSSSLRDMALSLFVIASSDKNDSRVNSLTRLVADNLRNNKRLTTQEAAFGFLAIGKALSNINNNQPVSGTVNDDKKELVKLESPEEFSTVNSKSGNLKINSKSAGKLFYFVSSAGIPKDGKIENQDSYIKVRRTLYNKSGNEVKSNKFKSGDVVVVKISVNGTKGGFKSDNVVVSDLLPAGFEVENPRLVDLKGYPWIKQQTNPIHYDYRDDRVNIYFDFDDKAEFYYTMRAISPGKYTLGSVSADAMYSGDVFSINGGGGFIEISGR